MRAVEKALHKLEGRIAQIKRNPNTAKYEIQVAFPKNWHFQSTKNFELENILGSENGVLLNLSTSSDEISIDDMLDYIQQIVDTNEAIEREEKALEEQMEAEKKAIEKKFLESYKKIQKMKEQGLKSKQSSKTTRKKQPKKTTPKREIEGHQPEEPVNTPPPSGDSTDKVEKELAEKLS
jgi:hypothetical protein